LFLSSYLFSFQYITLQVVFERQAALLGWFASAGSLSRIILPITTANLDVLYDNSPFFIVLLLLCSSAIMINFFKHKIKYFINSDGAIPITIRPPTSYGERLYEMLPFALIILGAVAMFTSSPGGGGDYTGLWSFDID